MTKASLVVIVVSLVSLLAAQDSGAKSTYEEKRDLMIFGGRVNVVLPELDGGLLIGGDFSRFRGKPVPSLVRLNADGSLDPAFSTFMNKWQGTVRDLIRLKDGKILVVGEGLRAENTAPSGILKLNKNGSLDAGFQVKGDAIRTYSKAIALPHGEVVVMAGVGIPCRLMGDGTLERLNPRERGVAQTFAPVQDNKILIALIDSGIWKLRRWTADGEPDTGFPGTKDLASTPTLTGGFNLHIDRVKDGIKVFGFEQGSLTNVPGGIERGDVLLSIAEYGQAARSLSGLQVNDVKKLWTGAPGSIVTFTLERSGAKGSPATTRTVSFRRELVDYPEHRRRSGRPEGDKTVFAVQNDGKVVVAREYGEQIEIFRLMPDGQADKRFNRAPVNLPPDEMENIFNDLVESDSEASEPIPFTENWRLFEEKLPPSVVAMATEPGGKIYVGLSDGHVLRLEPDGSLDATFHKRYEPEIGGIFVLRDKRVLILHGASGKEGGTELTVLDPGGKPFLWGAQR